MLVRQHGRKRSTAAGQERSLEKCIRKPSPLTFLARHGGGSKTFRATLFVLWLRCSIPADGHDRSGAAGRQHYPNIVIKALRGDKIAL
jgi:hypothetical protein